MTLTEDELARLAELEDLLTVGLVEQPINGSVLSWGEAALIAHRIGRHLLRATPVADTAGIDAAVVDALARVYNQDRSMPADKAPAPYLAVALVCDEQLDRSGALLGRVRDAAAAIRTPKPEGDR